MSNTHDLTEDELETLHGIRNGLISPTTNAEELFKQAYDMGSSGELLLDSLVKLEDGDGLTVKEYDFYLLGYGWGQYDYREKNRGLH